jgi:polysaccharide pyruvyl transferase WcaK-like protein
MSKTNRAMILGGNFCGNIGDLFIIEAVTHFFSKQYPNLEVDIFPYPIRHDKFVGLPFATKHPYNINVCEPASRLRGSVDVLMRRHPMIETLVSRYYYGFLGHLVRTVGRKPINKSYHLAVVLGGEMDTPYSQLDVHSYLREFNIPRKNIIYGPISISDKPQHNHFLRARFSEVENIAIRDPGTLKRLQAQDLKNIQLIPDCAFLAADPEINRTQEKLKGRIGVCLHARWFQQKDLTTTVEAICEIANQRKSTVTFYCTHPKEDYQLMLKLIDMVKPLDHAEVICPTNTEELHTLCESFDLVISDRLHGLLIALIFGCNILPLATRDKVRGYCEYLQINNYLTGHETREDIQEKIQLVLDDYSAQRETQRRFVMESSNKVRDYYRSSIESAFSKNTHPRENEQNHCTRANQHGGIGRPVQ